MKIAVSGAQGTIGSELVRRGCVPILCDLTQPNDLRGEINAKKPDILIHCAALTDVKYCEEHFKESFEINVRGTSNAVEAMPKDSLFIYLSTDHIFSGENWFYEGYSENHKPSPVNRYGFSKWGGELMARTGICRTIVVRSSKCFNYNWAKPTMDKLKDGEYVEMTDLIRRSFMHVNHFVDGLMYLTSIYKEHPNLETINISGDKIFSYYIFWDILCKEFKFPGKVIPRREELKEEAPRPFRAGLEIKLSRKLKFPVHSIIDGFELLKQGI